MEGNTVFNSKEGIESKEGKEGKEGKERLKLIN